MTNKELVGAVKALGPDLERWHAADLMPLISKWLHNEGTVNGQPFKLSAIERPIWSLVLAAEVLWTP